MEGEASSNGVAEAPSDSASTNGASTCVDGRVNCQSSEPIDKELHLEHGVKRTDLSLQIPVRPIDFNVSHNGKGSSRGSSFVRGILHGPSFKNQVSISDERSSLLNSDFAGRTTSRGGADNATLANYIASLSWKRCVSLPVTHASNLSPSSSSTSRDKAFNEQRLSHKREIPANVSRSLSVPVRNVVILRSGSFPTPKVHAHIDTCEDQICPAHLEDGDEEIPEEDAVCRICLDELSDGASSLRLECSCKGALRLIHEDCAVKWFSIKGNRICDICGQEILNLPVTLIRMQSSAQGDSRHHHVRQHSNSPLTRAWQDVVVLILLSTMCYFFFIEQLLVDDMKTKAVAIAAPFAFILGLLSSAFAVILACREYIWAYSAFQFALVVIFLHIFYSTLRVRAIYAILSASFAGLGIAMGINSFFLLVLARRTQLTRTQQMNSNLV